jgi:hypothetical protein
MGIMPRNLAKGIIFVNTNIGRDIQSELILLMCGGAQKSLMIAPEPILRKPIAWELVIDG